MFGIKPKIMTGTSSVTQPSPTRPAAQHGQQRQDAQPAPSARPNGRPGKGPASQPQPAAEGAPDPDDEPAPAELTGMDLIERELGGRVIEEIGDTGGSGGSSPRASKA
jgi:DNA polymerase III subunit gamma/tau